MRFFNTAGPIKPDKHYHIPPLDRVDRERLLELVRQEKYFVLHAPRQSGKTTALLALRDLLNGGTAGRYRCVYANVEEGQAARENVGEAMRTILGQLGSRARDTLNDRFVDETWVSVLKKHGPTGALGEVLNRWARAVPEPLVLLIDEIDSLVGDSLISVLRQLRAGYDQRPAGFPQSVVLCGVRDVRDYRIRSSSEKAIVTGGSAFNVKAESMRLGDFSPAEVRDLLDQHSAATGQRIDDAAMEQIWAQTQGQPWLVNALAYQACFEAPAGRDRTKVVNAEAIRDAAEALILRRDTHLDQLTDKLREERVRRVVEPLLSGVQPANAIPDDDLKYVRDLGLIARDGPVAIANPIYREVIPRDLTLTTQEMVIADSAQWYVREDGRLDMARLMTAFQEFFREHSEHWVERFQYREAGPQLLLQAFLQRIVNSGGRIQREYGLGRMRTDMLIEWPTGAETLGASHKPETREAKPARMATTSVQKIVVECKLLHKSIDATLRDGLRQTRDYMDRCAAEQGHLVIFDRSPEKSWEEKLFSREETEGGLLVRVWGM